MQRHIFLNRFFFPDHSATSQMLSDLAFYLAGCGREVHIITSQQRYDDPSAALPEQETIHGVHIHRIASTQFGRKALLGRGVDYLSFAASVRRKLFALARPGDIVVAKTDPPFLSVVAMQVAQKTGAHLVNWLQDLYPEVALKLGVPYLRGPIGRGLLHLRNQSLMRAAMNVAVGEKMAVNVRAAGASDNAVCVIPNWTDDEHIVPVASHDNPLRKAWQLDDKFVVGYSGNLGRAHEYSSIIGAAERLRDNDRICFVFIGGGHLLDRLVREVQQRNVERLFRFVPYQERSQLKYSLGVPDVHLLSLRPEVEGLIVPSKFYGIAAAGRPILAMIARDGEFAPLIEQNRCGVVVEPGQADMLAVAIADLAADEARCKDMGVQARRMLDAGFTQRHSRQRWIEVLDRLAPRHEPMQNIPTS